MARPVRAGQAAPVAAPAVARRPARPVHPLAWWAWALGCAVAVSLLHNPLVLVLLLAMVWLVVLVRRTRAPWARSTGAYLAVAATVIGIRMVFQVLMGVTTTGTVLFTLPAVHLPAWAAGIRLGGPVTLDGLLATLYDSLRLVGMILCVGAANTLAHPRRVLRTMPAALHHVSVAVVIALGVAPQLVESVQRVRRARRLRGGRATGWGAMQAVVVPVLEDAFERSLQLAAGMESRGFGRTRGGRQVGVGTTLALLAALLLVLNGTFWLLGVPGHTEWGYPMLALGLACGAVALRSSGRRLGVTRYRPDQWAGTEWLVTAASAAAVAAVVLLERWQPLAMNPPTSPPAWPQLDPGMLAVVALVGAPLLVTPRPAKEAR